MTTVNPDAVLEWRLRSCAARARLEEVKAIAAQRALLPEEQAEIDSLKLQVRQNVTQYLLDVSRNW